MAQHLTKQDLPPGWRLSRETAGAAVRSEGRHVAVVRPSESSSKYVWSIQGHTGEFRRADAATAFKEADEWLAREKANLSRLKRYTL